MCVLSVPTNLWSLFCKAFVQCSLYGIVLHLSIILCFRTIVFFFICDDELISLCYKIYWYCQQRGFGIWSTEFYPTFSQSTRRKEKILIRLGPVSRYIFFGNKWMMSCYPFGKIFLKRKLPIYRKHFTDVGIEFSFVIKHNRRWCFNWDFCIK